MRSFKFSLIVLLVLGGSWFAAREIMTQRPDLIEKRVFSDFSDSHDLIQIHDPVQGKVTVSCSEQEQHSFWIHPNAVKALCHTLQKLTVTPFEEKLTVLPQFTFETAGKIIKIGELNEIIGKRQVEIVSGEDHQFGFISEIETQKLLAAGKHVYNGIFLREPIENVSQIRISHADGNFQFKKIHGIWSSDQIPLTFSNRAINDYLEDLQKKVPIEIMSTQESENRGLLLGEISLSGITERSFQFYKPDQGSEVFVSIDGDTAKLSKENAKKVFRSILTFLETTPLKEGTFEPRTLSFLKNTELLLPSFEKQRSKKTENVEKIGSVKLLDKTCDLFIDPEVKNNEYIQVFFEGCILDQSMSFLVRSSVWKFHDS